VTGITISGKQVEIAKRLTLAEAKKSSSSTSPDVDEPQEDADGFIALGKGKVKFIELDAEKMGDFFAAEDGKFDAVWISEALSHFPNKALFFHNVNRVLRPDGRLALADWFKADGLTEKEFADDIKPIEGEFQPFPLSFVSDRIVLLGRYLHGIRRRHAAPSPVHAGRVRQARHRGRSAGAWWAEGY
jgi:SAM-dependent methyltransferase